MVELEQTIKNVYFLGIGGIGMSALARYFKAKGYKVAGYDRTPSALTQKMQAEEEIRINYIDEEEEIPAEFRDKTTTLVVYTPAIPGDNRQQAYFVGAGFDLHKRAEVLGMISRKGKAICVAGTHGKTVSTLTAFLLKNSTVGCNAFLGGIAANFGTNLLLDRNSSYIVIEADEFDRSFLHLSPEIAVITAMDEDHLDIYENNAYEIQNELLRRHPDLNLLVLIGSVRNHERIDSIFEKYRPDLVFHAAAHKHVPLMEVSPNEAIKNNVLGTWVVANAADKFGAKKMVLISTDKAVRPTNIMGASKRICELIVQSFAQKSHTEYAAVRFGNVLGSNGSVIPLFRKQIAEGGPVTVTHPEIIRYFMTIPEAVSLVLQAGAYAKGGEIFVLDMGEPVKILDLAENMIRLSGLVPGEDIEIKFTGLRPGEKLYEELLIDDDNKKETANKRIFIGQPIKIDEAEFDEKMKELEKATFSEDENIRQVVKKLVPEYTIQQINN